MTPCDLVGDLDLDTGVVGQRVLSIQLRLISLLALVAGSSSLYQHMERILFPVSLQNKDDERK